MRRLFTLPTARSSGPPCDREPVGFGPCWVQHRWRRITKVEPLSADGKVFCFEWISRCDRCRFRQRVTLSVTHNFSDADPYEYYCELLPPEESPEEILLRPAGAAPADLSTLLRPLK